MRKEIKIPLLIWVVFEAIAVILWQTQSDLFYLLKKPVRVRFRYDKEQHIVESADGETEPEICFDGKWFRTCKDFFMNAQADGTRLTALCYDLFGFEVI